MPLFFHPFEWSHFLSHVIWYELLRCAKRNVWIFHAISTAPNGCECQAVPPLATHLRRNLNPSSALSFWVLLSDIFLKSWLLPCAYGEGKQSIGVQEAVGQQLAPPVFCPGWDPSGISKLACCDAPNLRASPAAWLSPHTLELSANEEGSLRLIPSRGLLFLEWLFSILLDEIVRIESCAFKSNSFEGISSSRSNYFCSGVIEGGKSC